MDYLEKMRIQMIYVEGAAPKTDSFDAHTRKMEVYALASIAESLAQLVGVFRAQYGLPEPSDATDDEPPPTYSWGDVVEPDDVAAYNAFVNTNDGERPENAEHLRKWVEKYWRPVSDDIPF